MAASVGPHGIAGALSPRGSHLYVSPPLATQGPSVSRGRRPGQLDPSVAEVHQGSAVVAPGGQMAVRGFSAGPSPILVVVYRYTFVGLGRAPVGSDGLRGLV